MGQELFCTLNNGIKIPVLGYGTFTMDNASAEDAVSSAIRVGYRHIDTASYYKNEKGVGNAVKSSGIPREEFFLTTKVWMDDLGYDKTMTSFEESLRDLQTDYLDLYLIHWPRPLALESWKAMETLYRDGVIKAIGVCNYTPAYLEDLIQNSDVIPAVNQVELHPGLQQNELLRYCRSRDIHVEAWSPIMKGQVLEMPLLQELGHKYGKNPVQITLRWHYQRGIIVIPKSVTPSRMEDNTKIYDFELTEGEMEQISGLECNKRLGFPPEHIYEKGFKPGDKPPQFAEL